MPISHKQMVDKKIVYPDSPEYNNDRKDFNNLYSAYPKMIVYVYTWDAVIWCINEAKANNWQTVVRSGGHSLAGYSVCNGMVIDVSNLNDVYVDPYNQYAVVGPGCNFGKLNKQLELFGMHVPGGGCPTVAVAGYMMGGGYGFTSRTFGMNCDNVLEVTVMLASGQIVVANANQNQDLYWAIRGGTGNNFGVLLQIKYKIYKLGEIYGIQISYPMEPDATGAATALYTLQEQYVNPGQYPELGLEVMLHTDPKNNQKQLTICGTWVGTEGALNEAIQPLLSIPGSWIEQRLYGKYSYVNEKLLSTVETMPPGVKAFSRCAYFERKLTIADYTSILNYFCTSPNNLTLGDFEVYGGRINEVSPNEMAFIHRNVMFDFFTDAFFDEATHDREENRVWLNNFYAWMEQFTNGHSYQNYPNRDQTNWAYAYWGYYYDLLVAIKQKYDPNNFWHFQQSIGSQPDDQTQEKEWPSHVQKPLIAPETSPIVYENY